MEVYTFKIKNPKEGQCPNIAVPGHSKEHAMIRLMDKGYDVDDKDLDRALDDIINKLKK